jgi:acetyl-CoA carboxylase carboxyltransferase component
MTSGASMVLTGRAALEASGAVSAEDEIAIGGFERIMGPNGQAQYFASDLSDAYRILYQYYRYSYVAPGESRPRANKSTDQVDRSLRYEPCDGEGTTIFDFKYVGEIFEDETNPGRKKPFPMRPVMEALVDNDGGHLERWNAWVGAETSIVWDAHMGGIPATIIGIESHNLTREGYRPLDGPATWSGGTLFPQSSKKVARALTSASGNRPVIVLANLSGFDGSPESMRKLQLEYGAEIARAVVNFRGPLLFMVVSRYHGGAYVVFSQELNASLKASALEGTYASVIGGGPAAAVVFAKDVRARAAADDRVRKIQRESTEDGKLQNRAALEKVIQDVTLEKQAELAEEFDRIHSVQRAQEVGSLGNIISPDSIRPFLIAQLRKSLDLEEDA